VPARCWFILPCSSGRDIYVTMTAEIFAIRDPTGP
jgi:hypothetical protein